MHENSNSESIVENDELIFKRLFVSIFNSPSTDSCINEFTDKAAKIKSEANE